MEPQNPFSPQPPTENEQPHTYEAPNLPGYQPLPTQPSYPPPAQSSNVTKGLKKLGKLVLIIIVIIVLVAIGSIAYYFHSQNKNNNQYNTGTTTSKTPTINETPLGSSATAKTTTVLNDLSISVTGVKHNPATTGDKPDAGKEYLEIDLSIKNTGPKKGQVDGTEFSYLTGSGTELPTANTAGNGTPDSNAPGKNVEVSAKQRLVFEDLDSQATINRILIFQVQAGDSGKLVWYDGAHYPYNKLAIFRLE